MIHITRFATLASLVIAGCSSMPTSAQDEAASSESALLEANAENACAGRAHVTLSEAVSDYRTNAAMAGVEVCVQRLDDLEDRSCSVTGADGAVRLTVHNCKDVRVTFASSGYVSANQLLRIRGDVTTGTRLISAALAGQLAGFLGSRLDLTKSQPVITAYDAAHRPLAGLSVSLQPASGTRYYVATTGAPSQSLTATTAAGIAGVLNADVGTYDVQGTAPPGMSCGIGPYVPGQSPNSVRVEAIAGSAAEAVFYCQ